MHLHPHCYWEGLSRSVSRERSLFSSHQQSVRTTQRDSVSGSQITLLFLQNSSGHGEDLQRSTGLGAGSVPEPAADPAVVLLRLSREPGPDNTWSLWFYPLILIEILFMCLKFTPPVFKVSHSSICQRASSCEGVESRQHGFMEPTDHFHTAQQLLFILPKYSEKIKEVRQGNKVISKVWV